MNSASAFASTDREPATRRDPSADDSKDDRDGDTSASDDGLIAELAALPKLAYAKRRKEAAKQLGITAGELDRFVPEARSEAPKSPERWRVERWPEPVATHELLEELRAKRSCPSTART